MIKRLFAIWALLCLVLIGAYASAADSLIPPDRIQDPPLHFDAPKIERTVLQNGIHLLITEDRELPVIRMTALVRAGSMYDPPGQEGLSEMTAALLRTGGAASKSADRVDQEIDFRAADISFISTLELCTADLTFHKRDAAAVMALFSQMITMPAFEPAKLENARGLMLEDLSRVYDRPQSLAFREFRRLVYDGNPRGRLPRLASIRALKREDLIDFHRQFFFPANLTLAITGDITKNEAISLVQQYFGAWRAADSAAKSVPNLALPKPRTTEGAYFINKDLPQSTVLIGYITGGKKDPDYYALTVLDFILGSGGFRSRITAEVRNEKGLAYSAGGAYSPRADFGVVQTYAMTRSSATVQVASLMRTAIQCLRDKPVSAEDLSWATRSIVNSYIFSMETPHQITVNLAMLDLDGMPGDFLTTFPQRIAKVTVQDVQRVARKYLDPTQALLFILGNKNAIPGLSSLGKTTTIDWTP